MWFAEACRVVYTDVDGTFGKADSIFHRYQHVLSALTQQSSELQDTRMLTEFLERVELEESQEHNSHQYNLGQVRFLREAFKGSLQRTYRKKRFHLCYLTTKIV